MPLGREVGLSPSNIVLDGDPAPPSQFSAHVYCGQTAGWIKMSLGMEVSLGLGHIVLHGDPATPTPKRNTTPNFQLMSIVAKRSPISATAEHLLLFMAALWNRAGHRIFVLWFVSSFFLFFFLSSPNLSGRRLDLYHTHGVAA